MNNEEQFVSVPVPAHRVQEVYALLAQASASQKQEPTPASDPESGWTEHLVRRMFKESGDPMQRMLRMLAEADGEEVSTNEIATELGLPKGASSVAGMAGAIGRRVNSRYGMKGLPWATRWRHIDPADETQGTETLISLPKWICKVIRDL
jgi:hypothetical protein